MIDKPPMKTVACRDGTIRSVHVEHPYQKLKLEDSCQSWWKKRKIML